MHLPNLVVYETMDKQFHIEISKYLRIRHTQTRSIFADVFFKLKPREIRIELEKKRTIPIDWIVTDSGSLSLWPRASTQIVDGLGLDEPVAMAIMASTIARVFCDIEPLVNLARLESVLNLDDQFQFDSVLGALDLKVFHVGGARYSPALGEKKYARLDTITSCIMSLAYMKVRNSDAFFSVVTNYEKYLLADELATIRDRFVLMMLFRQDHDTTRVVIDYVRDAIVAATSDTPEQEWFNTINATTETAVPCPVDFSDHCVNTILQRRRLPYINSVLAYQFAQDFLAALYLQCRDEIYRRSNFNSKKSRPEPSLSLVEAITAAYDETANRYIRDLSARMSLLCRGDQNNSLARMIPAEIIERIPVTTN